MTNADLAQTLTFASTAADVAEATLAYFDARAAYRAALDAEELALASTPPAQTFEEALALIASGETLPGPSPDVVAAAEVTAKAKEAFTKAALALGAANKAYALARK